MTDHEILAIEMERLAHRTDALIILTRDKLARYIDVRFGILVRKIDDFQRTIMATQVELQASLDAVGDQLTKASAEISAEIATLTAEIAAGGGTTPGVDASVARLQGLAQALDDLNVDTPPPPPAPPRAA